MNGDKTTSVHWSFWVIAGLGLIWYAMGCVNFFMQMSPDMLASYPESHRVIVEGRPVWATAGFALAVFGGALGSLLLLLRKSAAFYVFIAALVGVIVQLIHSLKSGADLSAFDMLSIILMPVAAAAFFIWYSRYSASKGWIN
ncbi:hypothetical protein [Roseovarius sp. Pro17]|uniref:hypothetical protein n=1 Tax=Roseovarius sp. Pro17 TaxID=3108175 RepID=UPI002D771D34|nr:hypothetical protein [Roseovarius sp. Pro17]